MEAAAESVPEDMEALRAAFLALRSKAAVLQIENARLAAENTFLEALNQKLAHYLAKLKRLTFGRSSEKLDPDQFQLALEDLEQKIAEVRAEAEKAAPEEVKDKRTRDRRQSRPSLPDTLPEVHVTIEPDLSACPCCAGALHRIGEDTSRRLDVIPVQYRQLVTHRPKYACRACEGTILQAPAPERLIPGGLPTEAMVASVVVGKYADHQPLYRQSQALARQGVQIGRDVLPAFLPSQRWFGAKDQPIRSVRVTSGAELATAPGPSGATSTVLPSWVGCFAAEVKPLWTLMREELLSCGVLFVDETEAPVLDPGRGSTKKGYMWTIARDPRPWGGGALPGVVFTYAPGRAHAHALELLKTFKGVVQCDGYGAYKALAKQRQGEVVLAHCWAHVRRDFIDLSNGAPAPIAAEALKRIAAFYAVETEIRGRLPDERRAVRQAKTRPLVDAFFGWLDDQLARVPRRLKTAEVIHYAINHREGLSRFLDDGRLELDTNAVERAIRPITLNRKNALFAGGDEGGEAWAILATLIECCKLHQVEPHAYLTDAVVRLVNGHPQTRLAELTPWAWKSANAAT